VAALQQDLVNWQGRYKKKDSELASQTSKVKTDCLIVFAASLLLVGPPDGCFKASMWTPQGGHMPFKS